MGSPTPAAGAAVGVGGGVGVGVGVGGGVGVGVGVGAGVGVAVGSGVGATPKVRFCVNISSVGAAAAVSGGLLGLDAPVLVNQEEVDSRAASLGLGYTLGDQGDEPATSPNGVAVTQKIGVAVVRTAH